ncbi:uncharacterized protein METZ01_LOCUS393144, partial [marine metagenome]
MPYHIVPDDLLVHVFRYEHRMGGKQRQCILELYVSCGGDAVRFLVTPQISGDGAFYLEFDDIEILGELFFGKFNTGLDYPVLETLNHRVLYFERSDERIEVSFKILVLYTVF